MIKNNIVIAYTDGGCKGNGKSNNIGSYAYRLQFGEFFKENYKAVKNTTNNQMELMAVVECLKALKRKCNVTLHTDSAYIVNAINQKWINKWKQNNWQHKVKNTYKTIANKELWEELDKLMSIHSVTFVKVTGHSNCEMNNRVDYLTNLAVQEYKQTANAV